MPDDITRRVMAVIAKTQRIPPETVRPDSTFAELKIDSLDGINLLFALETEFDISIPDDEAKKLTSVNQVVDGISKLLDAGGTE